MLHRPTHTSELAIAKQYAALWARLGLEAQELPRKRTDRRYRRRCSTCRKFLKADAKNSYCNPCGAERQRLARLDAQARKSAPRADGIEAIAALLSL